MNFRILAVDGSIITRPFTEELKDLYGVDSNQSELNIVQARSSVLYDVLNGLALDAALENMEQGERDLALRHSNQWRKNDLVIYDRGYPSFEFIFKHIEHVIDCLIRAKNPWLSKYALIRKHRLKTRNMIKTITKNQKDTI
jgi:hypothetical protein